jgi:hypothetical protein
VVILLPPTICYYNWLLKQITECTYDGDCELFDCELLLKVGDRKGNCLKELLKADGVVKSTQGT